ncbi:MAG: sigma-70 family RNA polymerase sigma factor [Akkermansiaceae bacterium]|nr:sigma-70 family RNA polymerase sigma factor [Akkermansiaceae bacterium]
MTKSSYLSIIQEIVSGDTDAFGELVRIHEGWIRAFLRSRLRDRSAADDLAQDVFVTAFRSIGQYRGDGTFEMWLRGIAVNHLRNYIRKRRESYIGGFAELEELLIKHPEPALEESAALDALMECLDSVDSHSRDQLYERYVKGRTLRDLCRDSGAGYSALTMKFHRLRELLAVCVRDKLKDTLA